MTDFFLRIEPDAEAARLTPDMIEQALRTHGLMPRHAMQVGAGWLVHARRTDHAAKGALPFPEGWRVIEEGPVLAHASWPAANEVRAVGEVFTYALLLWPAVVGLFVLQSQGWQLALKIVLAVWLGLFHLVAYRGAGGRFLGNSMLMLSACVAAFWWSHPGAWMYPWLLVIVIGLYAAVRGSLKGGPRVRDGTKQPVQSPRRET